MNAGLLQQRVGAWRLRLLARDWLEGTFNTFSWCAGTFLVLALLDRVFALPYPLRVVGFIGIVAVLARGVWVGWVRPALHWTVPRVIAAADLRHTGLSVHLLPAWELARALPPHVSADLAAAQATQAQELLRGVTDDLIAWEWPRSVAAAAGLAICLALSWQQLTSSRLERVLAPWRRVALESLLDIRPLGARVPWGGALTVSARWRRPNEEDPVLYVRSPDAPWREQDWDRPAEAAAGNPATAPETAFPYTWTLPALSEEVQYRLAWRDQTTATYSLVPVPYPQFSDVRYRLAPPLATAEGAQDVPGGGDVEALRGTKVEIVGTTPDAVESAVLKVKGRPAVAFEKTAEGAFKAAFVVEGEGAFRWELTGPGGIRDPQPAEHKITALKDQPPEITLLSPTFELEIGPHEPLPVDFAASDDFGLTGVWLVSRARIGGLDSGEQSVRVPGLAAYAKDWSGEYRWDLSDFIPGTRVEFYLRAVDNARPPHEGRSERGVLRIVDFDAVHRDAQDKRAATTTELQRLQSAGEQVSDELNKAAQDPSREEAARAQEAALQEQWRQALAAQQQARDAIAKDPYQNPGVQESDDAALQDLADAAPPLLSQASQASAAKDLKQAAQAHKDLAREAAGALKRLKEDALYQDVQDFAERSKRMDRYGADIQERLEKMSKKGAGDKDWKALDKAMMDLQDQMTQLAQQVAAFAKQADNNVSSKDKIYSVPLMDAAHQSDALRKALAAHDVKGALAAARELSRQLAQIRQALEAAQQGAQPPQSERPSKELEKLLDDWEAATHEQEQRVAGARALEDERLKGLLQAQKDLLAELARRQKAVNAQAGTLTHPLPPEMLSDMTLAQREFEAAKLERAPRALEQTVARLRFLSPNRPDDAAALDSLRAQEQDILALLGRGASAPAATPETGAKLKEEGGKEQAMKDRIESLREEARSLLSEGMALPRKASQSLDGASGESGAAADSLSGGDSQGGLGHAQKALDLLEQGQQSAQQELQQQQQREAAFEIPAPGGQRTMSMRNQGAGGQMGSQLAPVKLPSASDYQPPQAIRRQVIESLQEKMPASQQPAIKQYLKNVAE